MLLHFLLDRHGRLLDFLHPRRRPRFDDQRVDFFQQEVIDLRGLEKLRFIGVHLGKCLPLHDFLRHLCLGDFLVQVLHEQFQRGL